MNADLERGSVLPFLELAKEKDIGVIVLNPNYNRDPNDRKTVVPYCHSMPQHCCFVWENYIQPKNKDIDELYLVAHSAGGYCVDAVITNFSKHLNLP